MNFLCTNSPLTLPRRKYGIEIQIHTSLCWRPLRGCGCGPGPGHSRRPSPRACRRMRLAVLSRPPWPGATLPSPFCRWVRGDKTELLLMRSVASPPCPSPASFLTLSYVLTALPLAEPKLPLPPAALSTQTHLTHMHMRHTQSHTPHTGAHVLYPRRHPQAAHPHVDTSTGMRMHIHTPSPPCACTLTHITHT